VEAPDSVFLQQKEICIYEMEANREGLLSGLLPQLAWSSVLQKRLGCFELAMEVKKDLRLEKGSQIEENPM